MNIAKTPTIIQKLFSRYQWAVETDKAEVFLTFDDGPTPGVTDWVLDRLRENNARATFFCVGQNVKRFPALTRRIIREGHIVGNHTYSHVSGWTSEGAANYLTEVRETDKIITEVTGTPPRFFRPPYGRINPFVQGEIGKTHKIVMWDVIAWDWDAELTHEACLRHILHNFQYGSIIVLHDSLKCGARMQKILPPLLQYFAQNNIQLSPLRWE